MNNKDKYSKSIKTRQQNNNNNNYYGQPNNKQNNNILNLELTRRKRSEINDLINKELRIKLGALNLLKVCYNEPTQKKLKLEIAFSDSNIRYLKDQLAELNCDYTLNKMKTSNFPIKPNLAFENLENSDNRTDNFDNSEKYNSSSIRSNRSAYSAQLPSNNPFLSTNTIKPIKTVKNPIYLKQFNPLPEITVTPSNDSYLNEFIPINIPTQTNNLTLNNSYSFSPSSSSTISTPTTTISLNTSILNSENSNNNTKSSINQSQNSNNKFSIDKLVETKLKLEYSLDEFQTKTADIMMYLNLKETVNTIDFSVGFKNFIINHFREDPNNFNEQIRQFNYFRESTIRLSYEPSYESIHRLFEYYNSLNLTEKRFFQNSQCNNVFFTWFDSINGIESTQKSIQFEKASILFNCAALFTQIAAICCDGNERKLNEQLDYWLQAAGCLNYLNTNFSNSPSLDMSSFMLYFFTDIFVCQAYEIKSKIILLTNNEHNIYDPKHLFVTYTNCSRIYSYLAQKYGQIHLKLANNTSIKNYIPEIWFYLIKVKSVYFKSLSHYYTSMAISCNGLDQVSDNLEIQSLFDSLHDKTRIESKSINSQSNLSQISSENPNNNHKSYFQKIFLEQQMLYNYRILKTPKRINLAKCHMRESIVQQEEALRQHSFCRKFSKDDYLHHILCYYHELSLDKFLQLDTQSSPDFDDELFDLLPINANLNDKLLLKPIEPNFQKYESKDFFNLIGPLKVYSSENELSIPYSCILRKLPNQQTFGITVKGDCPVRINQVDPRSYAFSAGIREGDFIIAIQDNDVRWSKHAQVVEKIRAQLNSVKLTLISSRVIPKEIPIFCDDNENKKIKNCSDRVLANSSNEAIFKNAIMTPNTKKKILSTNFNSNEANMTENHIWWNQNNQKPAQDIPKTQRLRQRLFRLPNSNSNSNSRSKSPFFRGENNLVVSAANKLVNLAKSPSILSQNQPSKMKSKTSFKSTSNLYTDKIQFNDEDDEICSRENAIFWENLKSIKSPIANTITLGRKFKRNVLKLNIFNSFNSSNGQNESEKNIKPKEETEKSDLPNSHKMPPLPPNALTGTVKSAKNKLLKKQKRLKELEKLNQDTEKLLVQNDQVLYKTI